MGGLKPDAKRKRECGQEGVCCACACLLSLSPSFPALGGGGEGTWTQAAAAGQTGQEQLSAAGGRPGRENQSMSNETERRKQIKRKSTHPFPCLLPRVPSTINLLFLSQYNIESLFHSTPRFLDQQPASQPARQPAPLTPRGFAPTTCTSIPKARPCLAASASALRLDVCVCCRCCYCCTTQALPSQPSTPPRARARAFLHSAADV